MAEWLRRQIRTARYLFPYGSAGSNPAGVVFLGSFVCHGHFFLFIAWAQATHFTGKTRYETICLGLSFRYM
jgi:hypothetical protein